MRPIIKLVYYENRAYHLYTRRFEKGYRFIRIERDPQNPGTFAYSVKWQHILRILRLFRKLFWLGIFFHRNHSFLKINTKKQSLP